MYSIAEVNAGGAVDRQFFSDLPIFGNVPVRKNEEISMMIFYKKWCLIRVMCDV